MNIRVEAMLEMQILSLIYSLMKNRRLSKRKKIKGKVIEITGDIKIHCDISTSKSMYYFLLTFSSKNTIPRRSPEKERHVLYLSSVSYVKLKLHRTGAGKN